MVLSIVGRRNGPAWAFLLLAAVLSAPLASPWLPGAGAAPAGRMEFQALDDFEDVTPWAKGDPKTDLAQKDAAVTGSTEVVHEGKRSLAFLVRVNWTPRPGEQYPKGWPMARRTFEGPQDWSAQDYVCFWLHARTESKLQQERVLRVGFPSGDGKDGPDWYTIPGIVPNRWQEVRVPLTLLADWKRVLGVSFYVAEQWYEDGDAVDFFIDDMRLARLTVPGFVACDVTSRTFPRGESVGIRLRIEGPHEGAKVRCRVTDLRGKEQAVAVEALAAKEQEIVFPAKGLPAGGHRAVVELLGKDGKVVDARRLYFRSLESGKRTYLKLISFYTKPLGESDPEALKVLNDSAYAGVAIPLMGSYSTDPIPEYERFAPAMKKVRDALKIDPWPWVAINRMYGAPTDRQGHAASHATNLAYFERIKAFDLGNEAGARTDFLKQWRYAVRMAREWKSPGVMIDLEAYNDYRVYDTEWVARTRGEDLDETIRKCEALGADLAQIIEEEYPRCIVWSLFSRLEYARVVPGRKEKLPTTPSLVTLGLLRYAREHKVPLKYLCGGETSPGYCSKSVEELKRKIAARDSAVAPFLEAFPEHLVLAGTISPLHDYGLASGWIQKGYADSPFQSLTDFEPLFRTLFDAYDWVWIYASSAAQTKPYDPAMSRLYTPVLRKALDGARRN